MYVCLQLGSSIILKKQLLRISEVRGKYRDCQTPADKPTLPKAQESCAVGRQDTCTGLCVSWFTRKTEDKRQQWLWYKLKSLWIHHINMIIRAMCDQSKFNYLLGGLLAPRGSLILLYKDWELLIVPLPYQGNVFTNKWAASCPQTTRTAKAIDQSIHQAKEILLSGPLCAQQGSCSQTTFGSSRCCPGSCDQCPCVWPSHFLAHNTALHWRRGGPLISGTCWVPALSWLHPSSQLPGLSTVLAEVHLWRSHCPDPPVSPCCTNPQSPSHTAEKSSHFIFPVQSTKSPCMRTYLPAWRRVAQNSPMGEKCSERGGVAIYVSY